jgi:hypothetical protein
MPLIRIVSEWVVCGNRRAKKGDVVDWPQQNAQPVVDAGMAEWFEPPRPKAKAAKAESEDG